MTGTSGGPTEDEATSRLRRHVPDIALPWMAEEPGGPRPHRRRHVVLRRRVGLHRAGRASGGPRPARGRGAHRHAQPGLRGHPRGRRRPRRQPAQVRGRRTAVPLPRPRPRPAGGGDGHGHASRAAPGGGREDGVRTAQAVDVDRARQRRHPPLPRRLDPSGAGDRRSGARRHHRRRRRRRRGRDAPRSGDGGAAADGRHRLARRRPPSPGCAGVARPATPDPADRAGRPPADLAADALAAAVAADRRRWARRSSPATGRRPSRSSACRVRTRCSTTASTSSPTPWTCPSVWSRTRSPPKG